MNLNHVRKIRDQIITAALPEIPFEGRWHWLAIKNAAANIGIDNETAHAVFPAKTIDALTAFADLTDRKMLEELSKINLEELRIRERISQAVLTRLEILTEHKDAERLALQFWTAPMHKPRALQCLWSTADHIWNWAGDQSNDYNHYTKRAILSAILASTTLVWLQDQSEKMEETRAYLDRRIENVMQFEKFKSRFFKTSLKAAA